MQWDYIGLTFIGLTCIFCIIQVDYTVSRTTALGTKKRRCYFKNRGQGSRIFSRKYLFETLKWAMAMGGGKISGLWSLWYVRRDAMYVACRTNKSDHNVILNYGRTKQFNIV